MVATNLCPRWPEIGSSPFSNPNEDIDLYRKRFTGILEKDVLLQLPRLDGSDPDYCLRERMREQMRSEGKREIEQLLAQRLGRLD
jgi:hypothetical protein